MSSTQEEQNKQVVHQVFEFYNQQEIEKVEKLFSPKHVFHFPGAPPMDWNSHKQFIVGLSKAFPDLHFKVEDILTEGDKVAYRLTVSGTHKGEFQGIPATGKIVSFEGFLIQDFDVDNGKMAVGWIALDLCELLWKLRPMPHPKTNTQSKD